MIEAINHIAYTKEKNKLGISYVRSRVLTLMINCCFDPPRDRYQIYHYHITLNLSIVVSGEEETCIPFDFHNQPMSIHAVDINNIPIPFLFATDDIIVVHDKKFEFS